MIVARGLGRGAFLGAIVAAGFGLSLVVVGDEPTYPRSDVFSAATRADALMAPERSEVFATEESAVAFTEAFVVVVITAETRVDAGFVTLPVHVLPTPEPDLAAIAPEDGPVTFFSPARDHAVCETANERTDVITTPAPVEIATDEDRSNIG